MLGEPCKYKLDTNYGELLYVDVPRSYPDSERYCERFSAKLALLDIYDQSMIDEFEGFLNDCTEYDRNGNPFTRYRSSLVWRIAIISDPDAPTYIVNEKGLHIGPAVDFDKDCSRDGFITRKTNCEREGIQAIGCGTLRPFLCMGSSSPRASAATTSEMTQSPQSTSESNGLPLMISIGLFALCGILVIGILIYIVNKVIKRRGKQQKQEDSEKNETSCQVQHHTREYAEISASAPCTSARLMPSITSPTSARVYQDTVV